MSTPPFATYVEGGKDSTGEVILSLIGRSNSVCVYLTGPRVVKFETDTDAPTSHDLEVFNMYEPLLARALRTVGKKESDGHALIRELASALFNALSAPGTPNWRRFFESVENRLHELAQEKSRVLYVIGGFIAVMLAIAVEGVNLYFGAKPPPMIVGGYFGLVGSFLSVLIRSNRLSINPYASAPMSLVQGLFRGILGFFFGLILVVAIDAKFLLTAIADNQSAVKIFALIAGFSETMIPEILSQLEKDAPTRHPAKSTTGIDTA